MSGCCVGGLSVSPALGEAIRGAGLHVERIVCVAGGARSPLVRQLRADVTGLPVAWSEDVETTARGAAMLAAVGAGFHDTALGVGADRADRAGASSPHQPGSHSAIRARHLYSYLGSRPPSPPAPRSAGFADGIDPRAHLDVEHPPPLHTGRGRVRMAARASGCSRNLPS